MVDRWLSEADIEPQYEPHELETGLTGRGMSILRPDFYLPDQGIYIEVTLARRCLHLKQAKVRAAASLNQVAILLITRDELEALHSRHYSIRDFIKDGIADHAMELKLAA